MVDSKWAGTLQSSDLEPIVCQILEQPTVEILEWSIQSFVGGAGEHFVGGLGVYRLTGTARHNTTKSSWSVVLKAMKPSDNADINNPKMWSYWKREVLVYQSRILNELPGNLVAPRCYAIQESNDGMFRLWLEDIHETNKNWAMEDHQLAARHLGQFNGAYVMGHPLPKLESWMTSGRTHQWTELYAPQREQLVAFSEKTVSGNWLSSESIDHILELWAKRDSLLAKLDQLPTCFCHHDAFRRNLMLRQTQDGSIETVAIDWAYTGSGKLGQEIGMMIAVNLSFMEVAASKAQDLDKALFEGYCQGLREAGWRGDLQLARFGYTTTAALTIGVTVNGWASYMQSPEELGRLETIIGHPIDDIMEQWAVMQPFLNNLGDEALQLMDSI